MLRSLLLVPLSLLSCFILQQTIVTSSAFALPGQAATTMLLPNDFLLIKGGSFTPFYQYDEFENSVVVAPFMLQQFPVSNREFLDFVIKNPKWRRDKIPAIFAETNYLSHWASPTELKNHDLSAQQPVVLVSWFAAQAYCASINARLPTHFEWEFAAMASETAAEAQSDPEFTAQILSWYSKPTPNTLNAVNSGKKNFWGLYNMHGLVWQWVADFHSIFIKTDARQSDNTASDAFCGSSALSAEQRDAYPSFLRLGFLSSLKARYVTKNLGFRCARSSS